MELKEYKQIKQIFDVYAKSCQSYFKNNNFDDLQVSYLNSSMFIKFCKDFQVTDFNKQLIDNYNEDEPEAFNKITKYSQRSYKIIRIFRKNSFNINGLVIEEFIKALEQLACFREIQKDKKQRNKSFYQVEVDSAQTNKFFTFLGLYDQSKLSIREHQNFEKTGMNNDEIIQKNIKLASQFQKTKRQINSLYGPRKKILQNQNYSQNYIDLNKKQQQNYKIPNPKKLQPIINQNSLNQKSIDFININKDTIKSLEQRALEKKKTQELLLSKSPMKANGAKLQKILQGDKTKTPYLDLSKQSNLNMSQLMNQSNNYS